MQIIYFPKCRKDATSIVDALKQIGVKDPTLQYRKKIGKLNGIGSVGDPKANQKMLELLKAGKLIKSKITTNADKYVSQLGKIHAFIKKNGKKFFYSYPNATQTFAQTQKKVASGKKTGLTCIVPTRWGMKIMGIDPANFYGKDGHFSKYTSSMKKYLTKMTNSGPCGYTLKEAIDKKLLKKGDIIVFNNRTHTVSYSGIEDKMYDGGSIAQKKGYDKVGILIDYLDTKWRNRKISEILRWK